jgi:hypothetical protein
VGYLTDLDPRQSSPFTLGLKRCLEGESLQDLLLKDLFNYNFVIIHTLISLIQSCISNIALRKVETSFVLRSINPRSKPLDTTNIFEMIVAYNPNFSGHDQQVRFIFH